VDPVFLDEISRSYPDLKATTIVERYEERLKRVDDQRWDDADRSKETYTQFVLGEFEQVGESLGFEYNMRGKSILGTGEYLSIDQVWFHKHKGFEVPVVTIEHENEGFKDIWDDELNKLLDIKSKIKILIYHDKNSWERQLSMIEDRYKKHPMIDKDEEFIIMDAIEWEENMNYQVRIINQTGTESRTLKV